MFPFFRSLDVMNDVCEMFRSLNSTNGVANVDSMNGAMRIFRDRAVGIKIAGEGLETHCPKSFLQEALRRIIQAIFARGRQK